MKKLLGSLLSFALFFSFSAQAFAEYPEKPIRLIVPWGAGGGTDLMARALAQAMKEYTDAPIIVENITGAGGSTGNKHVAEAEGDGYTVLFNGDTDLLGSLAVMKTGYTLDDFKYVGSVFYSPTWILTNKESGIKDFNDFLAKAKANPNKFILASSTPSGAQMIMAAQIQEATKAPFRIIPYQGGKEMAKVLLGNQAQAGIIHAPIMLPEVKAGLIDVIATGGTLKDVNHEALRDMKTLTEIGIPVEMGITRGLMVPASTPDDVVAKLTEIVEKAAKSESFAAFGERFGFAPQWEDGAKFKKDYYDQYEVFKNFQ